MSSHDRAAPKGDGWEKNRVRITSPWKSQWTHENGTIRRDHGKYLEIIRPNGWRQYSGDGEGYLIFPTDGEVEVYWNGTSALASAHGAGNQKHRITKATGKRLPARLDDTFGMIYGIRGSFVIPDDHRPAQDAHEIPGLPSDPDSPRALELLSVFHREAYQILSAIVRGDAGEIHRIAVAVENHEGIRTGELETPMDNFLDIVKAIQKAATHANGPPERSKVTKEFNDLVSSNRQKPDLRDELGKMGFGWLPAPGGKPSAKVG